MSFAEQWASVEGRANLVRGLRRAWDGNPHRKAALRARHWREIEYRSLLETTPEEWMNFGATLALDTHRQRELSGYQKLAFAMIECAVRDAIEGFNTKVVERHKARRWIEESLESGPKLSLDDCCTLLRLDTSAVRRALLKLITENKSEYHKRWYAFHRDKLLPSPAAYYYEQPEFMEKLLRLP